MSQVSIVDIEHNNPQIPTRFNANVGFAIPIGNVLEILGDTVPAGTIPVYTTGSGNTITTNVQLSQAIAASDATRVGLAAFDSASFDVDANGFVTFTGSAFEGLTPDTGGQVVPVLGNINVFGQKALVAPVMTTHNIGGDLYIENRAWETQYVVDASTTVGIQGTYSTVQAAINQAVADGATLTSQRMIYVRYGTYVENLTIPPGIFLKGDAMVAQPGALPLFTEIRGNHTFGDANLFRCQNIYFTNVDPTADMFTSGTIIVINAYDCVFNNGNSTGFIFTLDFNYQQFFNCIFYGNSQQPVFDLTSSGMTTMNFCQFPNGSGINLTQNLRLYDCYGVGLITCNNGSIIAYNTQFVGGNNCVVGTGAGHTYNNCEFSCSVAGVDYAGSQCYFENCYGNADIFSTTTLTAIKNVQWGNTLIRTEINTNYTVLDTDQMIWIDTSGGPITITLTNTFWFGRTVILKDVTGDAQLNNVTIQVQGGGTIDGDATFLMDDDYECCCLQYTGTAGVYQMVWDSAMQISVSTSNSNKQFIKSGNTYNINFAGNLLIGSSGVITTGGALTGYGNGALAANTVGGSNVGVGNGALALNTAGGSMVAIGAQALGSYNFTGVSTMVFNVAVGTNSLFNLTLGTYNTVLGNNAGFNYTTTESDNILIRNRGTIGESNTLRIGTQGSGAGQINRAFMAGITAVTVAASSPVGIDTNGQLSDLGFGNTGQVFTSNGAGVSPSWQPASSAALTWQVDSVAASVPALVNHGYIDNNTGSAITYSLPATSAVGSMLAFVQHSTPGAWIVSQAAGQQIYYGNGNTTLGVGGFINSTAQGDSVEMVCVVADTIWRVINSFGTIAVT